MLKEYKMPVCLCSNTDCIKIHGVFNDWLPNFSK